MLVQVSDRGVRRRTRSSDRKQGLVVKIREQRPKLVLFHPSDAERASQSADTASLRSIDRHEIGSGAHSPSDLGAKKGLRQTTLLGFVGTSPKTPQANIAHLTRASGLYGDRTFGSPSKPGGVINRVRL